jgi:hypothetical protein
VTSAEALASDEFAELDAFAVMVSGDEKLPPLYESVMAEVPSVVLERLDTPVFESLSAIVTGLSELSTSAFVAVTIVLPPASRTFTVTVAVVLVPTVNEAGETATWSELTTALSVRLIVLT